MKEQKLKNKRLWRRHKHIRNRVIGTPDRPRLNVFRSNKNIYCQIIDDSFVDENGRRSGKTLASYSSLRIDGYGGNIKAAEAVGKEIAKIAKEKGIEKIVFDRGGYKYHGRVKALAESARKDGLSF